jgi:hypothetical protein
MSRRTPSSVLASAIAFGAVALSFALAPAAAAAPAVDQEAAERAFTEGRWQEAFDLYSAIEKESPEDPRAKLRAGIALVHLGRAREALVRMRRAEELGWLAPAVAFRLATAHAALGEKDEAIRELRRGIAAGLGPATIQGEPLLEPLRGHPDYQAVLTEADRIANPCRHDPRYRAFDFWLGEWDVRPNSGWAGALSGTNSITLEYNDCVIVEHWQGAGGGSGSSFNIFDASRNKWFQTWVDSSGGLHEYSGNFDAEGNLLYTGELAAPGGGTARVPTRLTFFKLPNGQVRQLSESSTDQGKTWTVNYDLLYTRRSGQ